MIIFAVQNGGWCAAATNLNGYRKYGKAGNCKNGKGGPWANDVYRITNPIKPALPKGITILSILECGRLSIEMLEKLVTPATSAPTSRPYNKTITKLYMSEN